MLDQRLAPRLDVYRPCSRRLKRLSMRRDDARLMHNYPAGTQQQQQPWQWCRVDLESTDRLRVIGRQITETYAHSTDRPNGAIQRRQRPILIPPRTVVDCRHVLSTELLILSQRFTSIYFFASVLRTFCDLQDIFWKTFSWLWLTTITLCQQS